MVEFSPETLKLGKSAPDRFKRMLAAEIKTLPLAAATRLTFRGKSASGAPILYVVRLDKMDPETRNRVHSYAPGGRVRQGEL
jgi:hypothetical protein